jgi:transcriptional antiterminator NusG
MKYYVLQVRDGGEEKLISAWEKEHPESPLRLFFPKREKRIRKLGKTYKVISGLFTGYIILADNEELAVVHLYQSFQGFPGFTKFLPSNQAIRSLSRKDELLINDILRTGTTITAPTATFDKNDRIVILDGPFKGYEGNVVLVDRKRRLVRFILESAGIPMWLPYNRLEPTGSNKPCTNKHPSQGRKRKNRKNKHHVAHRAR